jgi:hypothetical protein
MPVDPNSAKAIFLTALDKSSPDERDDPPTDPGAESVKPREWQPRPPLTPEELAKLPSPLDGRKRADIPPGLLALAGGGDPDKAPAEPVAVLGFGGPFTLPRFAGTNQPEISPDGKWLAVSCGKDVAVFDAATGALRRTLVGATQGLHRIVFSPDGKRVGAGCADGNAYVWETDSGKLEVTLEGTERVMSLPLALTASGSRP